MSEQFFDKYLYIDIDTMTQQIINVGTNPNDGTGDTIRSAMDKVNENFSDLYTTSYASNVVSSFNTRSGVVTLSASDISSALTYTPLNKAGDTMTGVLLMNQGFIAGGNGSSGCTISQNAGSTTSLPSYPTGSLLRAVNVDGTSAVINAESYNNAGNPNSSFLVRAARGTGVAPSAIQNTDVLGGLTGLGYGATHYQAAPTGAVQFISEGVFTDISQPTAISFQVTPSSSVVKAEQMRLTSAGVLEVLSGVGSSGVGSGALVVTGGASISGNLSVGGSFALSTVALTGGTINNVSIGATTPSTGAFTTLSASSTVSGSGFSTYLASPPAIGGSIPNAGAFSTCDAALIGSITPGSGVFTTLTASSTLTGFPGRLLNVQTFTSSGTYTPTTGTNHAIVEVQAPGGGSGGTTTTASTTNSVSSAGSSGSYAKVYWVSPTSQTVTIGTTGTAGTAASSGGTGGVTSLGSLVSCPGGIGGAAGTAVAPPFSTAPAAAPAAPTISGVTTIISVPGTRSGYSGSVSTTGPLISAAAASPLTPGNPIAAATGYGTGGSAAYLGISGTGSVGWAGGAGIIIVYEFS